MKKLYNESIKLIKSQQLESGAWYASPEFSVYSYCWFRDGSYIAYSMDVAGEFEAAEGFHNWALAILSEKTDQMSQAMHVLKETGDVPEKLVLHTRYLENGLEGEMEWENHQLDGLGTWLWAFNEHRKRASAPIHKDAKRIVENLAQYLIHFWRYPCYDLWEEYGDKIHFYTLSTILAGLKAAEDITKAGYSEATEEIKKYLFDHFVSEKHFTKFGGDSRVDASMVAALVPYTVFGLDTPYMLNTLEKIKKELYINGGVHRYVDDTYYGGGLWVLLTAWLGWYEAEQGNVDSAAKLCQWIEAQADKDFHLPEQVTEHLLDASMLNPWIEKWGKPAQPLLWSHAMYLILCNSISAPLL